MASSPNVYLLRFISGREALVRRGEAMDRTRFDVLSTRFLSESDQLTLQYDRRRQQDRRAAWRGGRRMSDGQDLFAALPGRRPGTQGVAQSTWVYDHDTLREHSVN